MLALTVGLLAQEDDEPWMGTIGEEETVEPDQGDSIIEATTQQEKLLDHMLKHPYPIRRLFSYSDIRIKKKRVRFESGNEGTLVIGWPRGARKSPTVFVFDVDSMSLSDPVLVGPLASRNRVGHYSESDSLKLNYLLTSPFGSNLLGNGFAVAYLIADDLNSLRSVKLLDWLEVFEHVRKHPKVDGDSFFLLSTREYANLSMSIAANYTFSAVVLEEPHYMLFSRNHYSNVVNRGKYMTAEQIWEKTKPEIEYRYEDFFSRIRSPMLLMRNANSSAYDFNEKTLLAKLDEANVFVEEIFLEGQARRLGILGREGVLDESPNVHYRHEYLAPWLESMVSYFRMNSTAVPKEIELKRR